MPAAEILPRLAEQYPLISLAPGNISDHMESVTQQRGWMETEFQPEQLGLEDIAGVAIKAYCGTKNFTLLHGVTGCHALRLVLPYCPDPENALRYFWQGLVIAYLSTGPKEIANAETKEDPAEWGEIRKMACKSEDDHVIKLCYSCWQEYSQYSARDYQVAASAAIKP